jgi:hypothetical protein
MYKTGTCYARPANSPARAFLPLFWSVEGGGGGEGEGEGEGTMNSSEINGELTHLEGHFRQGAS